MNFAIDYDGTFNEDPEFFHDLIDLIEKHGHRAVLITQRPSEGRHDDIEEDVGERIEKIFAGDQWKDVKAEEKGWRIDIWIDDDPQCVKAPPFLIGAKIDTEATRDVRNALWLSNQWLSNGTAGTKEALEDLISRNKELIERLANK